MLTKIFVLVFLGSLAYIFMAIMFPETGDSDTILLAGVIALLSFFAYVLSKRSGGKSSRNRVVEGYSRRNRKA